MSNVFPCGLDIVGHNNKKKKNLTEVTIMNALYERLYMELRLTELEIKESLQKRQEKDWLSSILMDELADIAGTMRKIEKGKYGKSEISGELLPEKLLKTIPTLKSLNDLQCLNSYYRKPLH
jgi:RNA polymerase-binding transcription factor DksA